MKSTIRIAPETILLAVAALVAAYLLIRFLSEVRFVIVVFLLAVIFAQAVEPLVKFFEKRARLRRPFAVIVSYLVVLQIFLIIGAIILPPLVVEIETLIINMPALIVQIQTFIATYYFVSQVTFPQQFQETLDQLAANLAEIVPSLLLLPLQVGSAVVALVTVLILSFYWLLISKDVKYGIIGFFPQEQRDEWEDIITQMSERVGGWVRGQLILSTTIGVLTLIGLELLNIPYSVVLAVWAGLMEVIPMVGPIIAAVPAVIVAFFISPLQAVVVIILYFVIQQVENHLIVPNVMSREVGLQPLVVILAILIGAELMGIVGALLAVPIAAALQVFIVRVVGLIRQPEQLEH